MIKARNKKVMAFRISENVLVALNRKFQRYLLFRPTKHDFGHSNTNFQGTVTVYTYFRLRKTEKILRKFLIMDEQMRLKAGFRLFHALQSS